MEKRRYYVSVQAKTIVPNQGDAPYELEIDATIDEKHRLERIFHQIDSYDEAAGIQTAFIIPITNWSQENNDGYDYFLKQAYALIYELGTEETRAHISQMKILK
ncbi:hypothetical protein V7148_00720 [Gottfriedia acidiceleris]|uniref:hypothetical protein n=1 Tax=Bacillaceae TaxID=186817 RepID=UPI000BEDCC6B|nr:MULTISPECIES: hypothetical protein [unclassified Bacillus (in: firmicutes)]PEC51158.1 hypothetical protein CON00_03735 [Bacillus sp. AFS096315]PFM77531.1 hypothetical protein COJ46_18660 [Bacillus sp. AFS077874]